MLGEQASTGPIMGEEAPVPHLLKQSLTVLGKIRDRVPKKDLSPTQFEHDIEEARAGISELCLSTFP